ncbi:HAMP domain-containing sensor histidine kinase [Rhodopirellula sp. JC639]|uniref:HAMP domain-containing sensor histidine kinase n=1 Tax=Stieleria mannarensis TaxID=2755585 RepID=UPI0015FEF6CA|nr:ATP-binding protein [Rhodopirellula sp. JC639]
MRKWKIRTKMVAGLSGLAFVIGLLVFNSWSQLKRDQYLAAEISQLADEIEHAHELNQLAVLLSQSYVNFDKLKDRIASNQMIGFEGIDESALSWEEGNIHSRLMAFRRNLDPYMSTVFARGGDHPESGLLLDRGRQGDSLREIDALLTEVNDRWSSRKLLNGSFSSAASQQAEIKEGIDRLVGQTNSYFGEIQTNMKQFRDSVHSEQRANRNEFRIYTALSAFLVIFIAWQFWTSIAVPFRTLFRGSQLIASGHHQHKILLGTTDEIGLMADTVNDITDRFNRAVANEMSAKQRAEQEVRDRTREVIQNEQLASVGFLAAGVAHEINNPLGAIAWGAEALEETLEELPAEEKARFDQDFLQELQTNLGLIQSEAFRCKGITERLLNFSRLSDRSRDQEDLGELVSRVVSMVGKVGEYRCKTIQTHADENVTAYCNSQEIQQVVLNLVSNALESVDTDGKVDVYVRAETDPFSGIKEAVVEVQDDGCGMDQEVMDHLFEPFFTRRRDDTGTGLGLSISYRIVSLHHGSLTPQSDGEGCGSKMTLRLPAEPAKKETVSDSAFFTSRDLSQHDELNSSTKWNDVQKVA